MSIACDCPSQDTPRTEGDLPGRQHEGVGSCIQPRQLLLGNVLCYDLAYMHT